MEKQVLIIILTALFFKAYCQSSANLQPSDYKVNGLKKFGSEGLMPVNLENNDEGSLFFWLAKKRSGFNDSRVATERLVVWLNGGPGCSSMVGMMNENGPFNILAGTEAPVTSHSSHSKPLKYYLKPNPYSWNEAAHVLFVEQPIRTGFSIGADGSEAIRDEKEVAADFRKFLLSFVAVFPEFQGMELFIAGESYAGFYIPWMASHIVEKQVVEVDTGKGRKEKQRQITDGINLVGVAIGNGEMDYLLQEPSYADYAYSHGLIPLDARLRFEEDWDKCVTKIKKEAGRRGEEAMRVGEFDECDMIDRIKIATGQVNEYNTGTFVPYWKIMASDGPFNTFFQDPEIQTALHVRGYNVPGINFVPEQVTITPMEDMSTDPTPQPVEPPTPTEVKTSNGFNGSYYSPPNGWRVCSDIIGSTMEKDRPISSITPLKYLVDNSFIRVLLYNGEQDLNCNFLGALSCLQSNEWRGRSWNKAERALWRFDGDVAGNYYFMEDVFAFMIVRNSGHLLPMDLPATALEMMIKFMQGDSFADTMLPTEHSYFDKVEGDKEGEADPTELNNEQAMRGLGMLMGAVLLLGIAYYGYQRKNKSGSHQGYTALNSRDGDRAVPYQWKDVMNTGEVELVTPQNA